MKKLSQLPEAESTKLKEIYESGDREELKSYIASLRAQQWPLRAIGEPLGLSRSTIQFWEKNYTDEPNDEVLYSPRAIETSGVKTVRWRTQILDGDYIRFRELAALAKGVRSQTPQGSPLRLASAELDALIETYLSRMVPITEIAKAMGVTHRAVKARIERRHENE